MKKLLYLLSITLLILQSCSSDSSDNSSSTSQLVGKWEILQVGQFPLGTIINSSTPLVNFPFECPTYKDYFQFGNQGSLKIVSYNNDCTEDGGIGTYIRTDNIINLYQNNIYQGYWEIISLTSTTLIIKIPSDISPTTGLPDPFFIVEKFIRI
jgi:hypothetical protein